MDGPNLYLPIWCLYWFPVVLPFNYCIKWGLTQLVTFVFGKCTHCQEVCRMELGLKSLGLTVAAEIAGLAVFYVVEMQMNLSFEAYYAHYTEVSVLALGVAMGLNYLLNYRFAFRKTALPRGKAHLLTGLIAVLTGPYLFLLPSGM